ncbi:MAG: permease [Caldilinea sp.]|nr:permease [Caldilinea sp.]MDW8439669.1 permease [Caldilineaceae bacterium]
MIVERPKASSPIEGSPPLPVDASDRRMRLMRWGLTLLVAVGAVVAIFSDALRGGGAPYLYQRIQTFVTIFLGIFIEAVPFLIAGSIVSGLIAVFVDQAAIDRYLPKAALPAALVGGGMGMVFPVCECGVVPVVRRLYEKGLPLSIGVAFLLAAPVVNPIVILSTYSAFGWGPVFVGRIVFSFLIAAVVGFLFGRARPEAVLRPAVCQLHHDASHPVHSHDHSHHLPNAPVGLRLRQAFNLAGDDFFDMARYLILGSMLAAGMQTLVPQSTLLAIGQGSVISVLAMQALAFVLSVCSTVDAFLALAFAGTFTTGSVLAFLVFGPMVDIKSSLMFLGVFQRRIVVYLITLPMLLSLLMGVWWNLNVRW